MTKDFFGRSYDEDGTHIYTESEVAEAKREHQRDLDRHFLIGLGIGLFCGFSLAVSAL